MSRIRLRLLVLSIMIVSAGGYTVHAKNSPEYKERIAQDLPAESIAEPTSAEAASEAIPLHPSALDDSTLAEPTEQDTADKDSVSTDSSHVLISAIKSVSGEIPENEFFALNWRVKYGRRFYSLANVDIALSNTDTDSVTSPNSKLTEAGVSFNYDVSDILGERQRDSLSRSTFIGGIGKIFNSEAYYGVILGSVELHKSPFFTSYFFGGYLRRFFPVNEGEVTDGSGKRLANNNLYTEFLIHSTQKNFFRNLAIKGGVLVPLLGGDGDFGDIQFRITIAVPIGGPITFR